MAIAFDIIKFVQHVFIIAVLYAAMTWAADILYTAYQQIFVAQGDCSQLSFQAMSILHMGLQIYIVVGLIMAALNAIASAAAKREAMLTGQYPEGGINTGIGGSIVCMIFIMSAIVLNFAVTAIFDGAIVTLDNAFPIQPSSILYAFPQEQLLFNLAHYIPLVMLFAGYLYMIFGAFALEVIDVVTGADY